MYCSRCGQQIGTSDAFCSRCGAVNPANAGRPETPNANPESGFAGQPFQEQATGQTAESTGSASSGPASSGPAYTRADYNPGQAAGRSAATGSAQKPGVTGSIVFSIVNIVLFGFGISFILGIIALIFTLIASNSTNEPEARAKLQAAKTLNIIGLVVAILQFITIIAIIIGFAAAIFNNFPR